MKMPIRLEKTTAEFRVYVNREIKKEPIRMKNSKMK